MTLERTADRLARAVDRRRRDRPGEPYPPELSRMRDTAACSPLAP
jgi:hypothetical protein